MHFFACSAVTMNMSSLNSTSVGVDVLLEEEGVAATIRGLADIGEDAIRHAAGDGLLELVDDQEPREPRRREEGIPDCLGAPLDERRRPVLDEEVRVHGLHRLVVLTQAPEDEPRQAVRGTGVHQTQVDGPYRVVAPQEADVLVGAPDGLAEIPLGLLQTLRELMPLGVV